MRILSGEDWKIAERGDIWLSSLRDPFYDRSVWECIKDVKLGYSPDCVNPKEYWTFRGLTTEDEFDLWARMVREENGLNCGMEGVS